MKSYLDLIPISAGIRRRQNRMTILCILFSVFLVTAMFSVADMMIRTERGFMLSRHGDWHIKLDGIAPEIAARVESRPDVTAAGIASSFNQDGDLPWRIGEKRAALYGTERAWLDRIFNGILEGEFPENDGQVMLSPNAADALHVRIGDFVTLHTPAGDFSFTVSGFGADDRDFYENQTFLVGVYLTRTAFDSILEQNGIGEVLPSCYVQFESAAKAADAMPELREQYGLPDGAVSENTGVMGIAGESENETVKNIYGLAFILFFLVLASGVLMISGSMNTTVAQRSRFFGMMRCIGASRSQIIRFVRLEALNWCKTAVPMGMAAGTAVSWGICAALRYGIGGEFATTPVFSLSPAGLVSGAAVGVITVLLAAQAPARRAARVSPMAAVRGGHPAVTSRRAARTDFGRIEISLGVRHAMESKKGWCLMTASFALCIVLMLAFSVLMDFAQLLLPSQAPSSADMALNGYANAMVLDRELVDEIKGIDGVENAYGCSYAEHIPAVSSRAGISEVSLVSYDDTLLSYAEESAARGDLSGIREGVGKVATVFNPDNPLQAGDTLEIGGITLEVSCSLSRGLFGDGPVVVCSQETFDLLVGESKYCLIGVQLKRGASDKTADRIRSFENDDVIVSDYRESNRQDSATWLASRIVVYGFWSIIAVITLFNIVNSISMSAAARTRQYGAMRAVGMDGAQLSGMIGAEALTYAVSGLLLGFAAGVPLNRFLYGTLITPYFGLTWSPPAGLLAAVSLFVFASAAIAFYAPAKRLRRLNVTAAIGEL